MTIANDNIQISNIGTESQPKEEYLYHIENSNLSNKAEKFLETFEVVLKHTNYGAILDMYSRSSTKCGRCSVTCPVYQVTNDPRDIPCYRTHILLNIYQRYFTTGGWVKSLMFGNGTVNDEDIDYLINSLYRCTACRRCTIECAMGIDHALITHIGRYILSEMKMPPQALQVATREQLEGESGNTSAVPVPALLNNVEFLEEEIEEEKGFKVKFPIDKKNVDYFFACPVSDYLMEADTLMGNALALHAMGEADNWTIGTENYDAINYGLFYSDWILERNIKRLVSEARRLNAKYILIGECGHASRSAKYFVPTFSKENPIPVVNCVELAYEKFKEGKLRLKHHSIKERITYHDPCNIARSGWIVEQPREILRHIASDFVEMKPNKIMNYCCGGGGGTVSIDEMHEFRMKIGGKVKADQLRDTRADIVVAPCANCKKQLRELINYYDLPMEVKGLHDLLYDTIEFDGSDNG